MKLETMRNKLKKSIQNLAVVIKHRNMELDQAVGDVKRAKNIMEKAKNRFDEASEETKRAEYSIRASLGSEKTLLVQDLIMRNNYLQNLRNNLSYAKTQYEMSSRVVDEATALLMRKSRQLEIVDRLKENKEKKNSTFVRNRDMSIMDELGAQKREKCND